MASESKKELEIINGDVPMEVTEDKPKSKKSKGYVERLKELLESGKQGPIALFTHPFPDPDAIASMMGMQWLLKKEFEIESHLFYDGEVSHPQQRTMVNLLDPVLKHSSDWVEKDYDFNFLLDTVPSHAGTADHKIPFHVVIDHHKETVGDFAGIYVNLKAGSCAGTVWHFIDKLGLRFEDDNDADKKVATALMVGIMTDCENLMAADTTQYESLAFGGLLEFKDTQDLQKIVNYERPKYWVKMQAEASTRVLTKEGFAVVGLGIVPAEHRDMVADMAQQMVQWEDTNTAVAFASIDGDRIEGCVRSIHASVSVPSLCKALGTSKGTGGGKLGKGAYRHSNYGSVDDDEGEDTKNMVWQQWNDRERDRIFRVIKK
jgi:nanoRNase/pAp phosphatase (c-di-AMP/oligoRNAs hydrolase)